MFQQPRKKVSHRRLVGLIATVISLVGVAFPAAASADVIGGSTFRTVYCGSNGGQISATMPTPQAPSNARWEYWYPEVFRNVSSDGNGHAWGGTLAQQGPVYARDLVTGLSYYQRADGSWSGAYNGLNATFQNPSVATTSAVDDWIEFATASGSLIGGWINEGYRGSDDYYGPTAINFRAYCF